MSARNVPAGHGWQWIAGALDILKRYPVPFLVMGLILAVIGIIPLLGGLVMLILGPALIAGTCYAAQQADSGGKPEIGHLFRGFQENDRIGPLIALCIPYVVGLIVIAILIGIFIAGAAVSAGGSLLQQAQTNPMLVVSAMGMSAMILIPLVLIVALLMYALVFFAIPRTMLERSDAFGNMKDSFAACRGNVGAFIVAILILAVGVIILSMIFRILHLGVIGQLLVSTGLYSILGSTLYLGYREVLGGGAATAASSTPPPTAPPAATQPPVTPPAPPEPPAPPPTA